MKYRRLLTALLPSLALWTTTTGCGVLEARLLSSGLRKTTVGPEFSEDPFAGMPLDPAATTAQAAEPPENQAAALQTAALDMPPAPAAPAGRTFLPGHLVEPASAARARVPDQIAATGRVTIPGRLGPAATPESYGNVMQASYQPQSAAHMDEAPRVLIPHAGRRMPDDAPTRLAQSASSPQQLATTPAATAPPFPTEDQQAATALPFPQRPVRRVAAAPGTVTDSQTAAPGGTKPAGAMTADYNPPVSQRVDRTAEQPAAAEAAPGANPFAPAAVPPAAPAEQTAAAPAAAKPATAETGWKPRSEERDAAGEEATQNEQGSTGNPPGEEWAEPR